VPFASLLLTTILIQVVLIVTYFSEDAFNFALDLTSALSLIPFLLAGAYAVKLGVTRQTYTAQPRGWRRELTIAAVATLYTAFLLFAAGLKFILVSFIVYAPATVLFAMARREQSRRLFSSREVIIFVISIAGAIVGIVALAAGWISI
jgi:arginine:ornithine antiporter / lysine permease